MMNPFRICLRTINHLRRTFDATPPRSPVLDELFLASQDFQTALYAKYDIPPTLGEIETAAEIWDVIGKCYVRRGAWGPGCPLPRLFCERGLELILHPTALVEREQRLQQP